MTTHPSRRVTTTTNVDGIVIPIRTHVVPVVEGDSTVPSFNNHAITDDDHSHPRRLSGSGQNSAPKWCCKCVCLNHHYVRRIAMIYHRYQLAILIALYFSFIAIGYWRYLLGVDASFDG
jgi:hypothetical protein